MNKDFKQAVCLVVCISILVSCRQAEKAPAKKTVPAAEVENPVVSIANSEADKAIDTAFTAFKNRSSYNTLGSVEEILKPYMDYPPAVIKLAEFNMQAGNHEKSVSLLDELAADPAHDYHGWIYRILGLNYLKTGNIKEAEKNFERSSNRSESQFDAVSSTVELMEIALKISGDKSKAREYFNKIKNLQAYKTNSILPARVKSFKEKYGAEFE